MGREQKRLYALGEIPSIFFHPIHVRKWIARWAIPPASATVVVRTARQLEQVPVPTIDSDEVLVLVMAAGGIIHGIWAVSRAGLALRHSTRDYHIAALMPPASSWAVGRKVTRGLSRDEVVIATLQPGLFGDDEECNGGDPMFSPSSGIWAAMRHLRLLRQFFVYRRASGMRREHLTWEEKRLLLLDAGDATACCSATAPHREAG